MSPLTHTLGLASFLKDLAYTHVLTLPCSIIREWFDPAEFECTWFLSREEEGVGIAVGLLAAGAKPIMLIQNSGLGNCVNAIASLAAAYEIPLVIGVSMRGDVVDENPAQMPMGRWTEGIIDALGCYRDTIKRIEDIRSVLIRVETAAQRTGRPAFVLLPRESQLAHQDRAS
jgi:sulfopyruvate decarboxylase subunit alpha